MVRFPNTEELEDLKHFKEPNCLTVYIPFRESDSKTSDSNRIIMKNILKEAHYAMSLHDISPKTIQETIKFASELLESPELWSMSHESLALFMHPDLSRVFHLPKDGVPAVISIRTGFNLVPLNEVMAENKSYYVLALSHNDVKLFEGTQFDMKPIHPDNFPTNLEKELQLDQEANEVRAHTIAANSSIGRGSMSFHSQYNRRQVDKIKLQKFFRRIDRSLHEFLINKRTPLVLAGVGYLLPIYKQVNTYPHLLKDHIVGNLEHANLNMTREKAWAIVR